MIRALRILGGTILGLLLSFVLIIGAITAFFGLSNRIASFSSMMPNPEFYLMGRVPREKKAG